MTRMKKNEKPGRVGGIGARLVAVASAAAMFLAVAVSGTAIAATTSTPTQPTDITKTATPKVRAVAADAEAALGTPKHTKTVSERDKDGNYTVSLNVTGDTDSSSVTETTPLDIVLVLDVSGSMADPISYTYTKIQTPSSQLTKNGYYYLQENGKWVQHYISTQVTNGVRYWYVYDTDTEDYRIYSKNGDFSTGLIDSLEIYTQQSDGPSKQTALVDAVNSFINKTDAANNSLPANAQKNQIALVKFAGNKSDNVGNDLYDSKYQYNYSQIVSNFTTNFTALKTTVSQLKPSGMTRADYGLEKAQDALQQKRSNAKQVVVFFTDGEPNNGSGFVDSIANSAIDKAKTLKGSGVDVYTVGVFDSADPSKTGTSNDNKFNAYMHAVSSNYPSATAWNMLGAGANNGYYQAATNADDLKKVFDNIQHQITTTVLYQGARIEDALSKDGWVEFSADGTPEFTYSKTLDGKTAAYTPANKASYDSNAGKIVWYPEGQNGKLEPGTTYTVSFKVKATQKAYDAAVENHKDDADGAGDNNFYTNDNDSAKVFYKTVTSVNGQPTVSDEKNAAYEKPTITLPTSKITVKKVWADGNDQHKDGSVTVQLKQDGKDYGQPVTLNADNDWSDEVTVSAGPTGHEYTASETAVDGYDSAIAVAVSTKPSTAENGVIKLHGLDEQAGSVTVTNTASVVALPATDLKVTKKVEGRAADNDFGFTLKCVAGKDANAGDCANVTGLNNNALNATVKKDSLAQSGAFAEASFGTQDQILKFKVPTGEATKVVYTFEISENGADHAPTGWRYDSSTHAVTVTVQKNAEGKWAAVVAGNNPTFTNRYIAVAALPLTGGTTGREWLAASGVLALLALTFGSGYAVWRKRQMA